MMLLGDVNSVQVSIMNIILNAGPIMIVMVNRKHHDKYHKI